MLSLTIRKLKCSDAMRPEVVTEDEDVGVVSGKGYRQRNAENLPNNFSVFEFFA